MTHLRRIAATLAVVAACCATLLALTAQPPTTDAPPAVTAPVADTRPGHVVETFAYPGADRIRQELGIVLKRGDGHIVLADCASGTGLLEVWARGKSKICFRATGATGRLTLEVPAVYAIKGAAGHTADVTLTAADSTRQDIDVPKDSWTPVGESADPVGRDFALLDIRTSR
ncbi:hypothetical protein [Streptomyces griseomycini]|uniref:Secreted protein n=1 Tax=Streptomyces griseomycini TaxID=66895 RepID=A0A7W7PW32_9ACTN|nr:hypothetical protein [Streptomyces griseomycini]MBB4902362.1 hypothetical protein [Streptomyces griseomycini]GGQ26674.1 hypothetical protein GCM10010266_57280 [Streptomyces griseomycini]GGR58866.1 hypothetical protein GCM10015536_74210 [Streptomyces griseomycini]